MRWLSIGLLALAACSGTDPGPGVSLTGAIDDPAGDGGGADIVFASAEVVGNELHLVVQLTPGSFQADSTLIQFNFDTDNDPATGYTTANPGHIGFGIDCLVEVGKVSPTSSAARVRRFDNGIFVTVINGSLTPTVDGYEAKVPADLCGVGVLTSFKVDSFRQVGTVGYTTRQDWAPDPGLQAERLHTPVD